MKKKPGRAHAAVSKKLEETRAEVRALLEEDPLPQLSVFHCAGVIEGLETALAIIEAEGM